MLFYLVKKAFVNVIKLRMVRWEVSWNIQVGPVQSPGSLYEGGKRTETEGRVVVSYWFVVICDSAH